jgi:hypothetical protein
MAMQLDTVLLWPLKGVEAFMQPGTTSKIVAVASVAASVTAAYYVFGDPRVALAGADYVKVGSGYLTAGVVYMGINVVTNSFGLSD